MRAHKLKGCWALALALALALGLLAAWLPAQAQTVRYVHTDALGSPVAMTDANRNVVQTRQYEPYGKRLNASNNDRPGYTGHVEDAATGLTYMQQRYYDPGIGRFLSVDPVTALSDPVGMFNRYKYAASNPYKFTDPDGRREEYAGGFGAGLIYANDPEKLRIMRNAEMAAGQAGAVAGIDAGAATRQVADAVAEGGGVREVATAAATAMATATTRKGKGKGGGAPHTSNARPSTKGKHEKGDARRLQDRGNEKGDHDRRPPRKPPPDHKGPWPPQK